MHLHWLGLSAFKMETKDAVVVTDPYSPSCMRKPLRAKADIVTVSAPADPAHNHLGGIQGEPFVIDHPGEFEVKGVFVQGIDVGSPGPGDGSAKGRRSVPSSKPQTPTTIFMYDVEGMRLAHLGDIRAVPGSEVLERMDGIDVLFVPVGGGGTLGAEEAAKVVGELEPKAVIPMHFAQEGLTIGGKLAPVSAFLKEMGASKVAPVERLLLKKRDLPTEETRVIVFQS